MKAMQDPVHGSDHMSIMWLLLIITLTVVPGVGQVTVLKTFDSYDTCKPERDRIGFEMAEAYPGENDFVIVCEFLHEGSTRRMRLAPAKRTRMGLDILKGTWTLNGAESLSDIRVRAAGQPALSRVHAPVSPAVVPRED